MTYKFYLTKSGIRTSPSFFHCEPHSSVIARIFPSVITRSISDEGISSFLLLGRNEIPHFVRNDGGGGVIASVSEGISSLSVRRLYLETPSGHRVPRSDTLFCHCEERKRRRDLQTVRLT